MEVTSNVESQKRFIEILDILRCLDFLSGLGKTLMAFRIRQLRRTRLLGFLHSVSQFRRLGLLVCAVVS
jgi:hypothetical protein